MVEVYYFAYGSNLHKEQQKERVGGWISSERAYAEGYRRIFNVNSPRWGGLAANLKKTGDSSDKVYGVVYLITKKQLDIMTEWENTNPTPISVTMENGQELNDVQAYIFPSKRLSGEPPDAYKDAILKGLNQHGYDQEVITQVQTEFYQ